MSNDLEKEFEKFTESDQFERIEGLLMAIAHIAYSAGRESAKPEDNE